MSEPSSRARSAYISASERVARLERQAGDLTTADPGLVLGIVKAQLARDEAGDRWEADEAKRGSTLPTTAGNRRGRSAAYSRPEDPEDT